MSGCSAAYWAGKDNPGTTLRINPITRTISFANFKDSDVEIAEVTFRDGEREFTLGKFTLRDNASDVRRANVEQILAVAEAQRVQVEYLAQMGRNLSDAIKSLAEVIRALPAVKARVETPVGSGELEVGGEGAE